MRFYRRIRGRLIKYYQRKYKDIILTLTGKNFVTVRGYCFHCKQDYEIEFYKDFKFPLRSRCGCIDCDTFNMMCFNDYGYYPPLIKKLDKRIIENVKKGI